MLLVQSLNTNRTALAPTQNFPSCLYQDLHVYHYSISQDLQKALYSLNESTWSAWRMYTVILDVCVCGVCQQTFSSGKKKLAARKEHSCMLIFISVAASWGHKMRPQEEQRHNAGRVAVRTQEQQASTSPGRTSGWLFRKVGTWRKGKN